MSAPWSKEERSFRQLQIIGVFDKITGLVMGKAEMPNNEGAPFDLNELLLEVIGKRQYPVISEFDCSHTVPMHTIGERCRVTIDASEGHNVVFKILNSFVE